MNTDWRGGCGGTLAAAVLLLLGSGAASACDFEGTTVNGTLTGVLVETMEHVSVGNAAVREAHAREAGTLSNGCGTLINLGSVLTVKAKSWIPINPTTQDLGLGPVAGSFRTDMAGGGLLLGSLDFRPTNTDVTDCGGGPCPFAWVSGTWTISAPSPLVGTFTGVALIPFACSLGSGWCYLDPTGSVGPAWTPIPIPAEALNWQGWPEATFLITLVH